MITIQKINGNVNLDVYKQIAAIHKQEINSGFLSGFNNKFLIYLYKAIAGSSYSFLYVALQEQTVVGFICGSTETRKLYRYFLLHYWVLVWPYIFKKTFSFKNLTKMIEILIYPKHKSQIKLPNSEILNFCVNSKAQRQGIGQKLFKSLVGEFKERSIAKIKIITGANQLKAQRFYEKLGANLVSSIELHKGVTSLVFLYKLV